MGNNDDFTFSQVGLTTEQDSLNTDKVFPNTSGITIKDDSSKDCGSNQSSGLTRKDISPGHSTTKDLLKTVGSLSFSVIDTCSQKHESQFPKEISSDISGHANTSHASKSAVRKPAPRAKIPFEKGYSQMDWLRLTGTHPDLAGLKGQSNKRLISINEVKQHQTEDTMWTVLKGRVYNLSPYMKFHPGGVDMLLKAVGKDCTSLFNKYHAWVNAEFLLEKCLVGILDNNQ